MTPQEYQAVCDKILTATLDYIDPANFMGCNITTQPAGTSNAIHASAVMDQAPITLVYTPAGTGKSKLVRDRATALVQSGMSPDNIAVLNMNIAKTNQMATQLPGIKVMTFNDFVEGLFLANFTDLKSSDAQSVLNSLKLLDPSEAVDELIRKLSVKNPQEQAVMMALYVNQKAEQVLSILRRIGKADSQLQSLLCQNYDLQNDPHSVKAIIINGVHNMPLPVFCCVLQYANKHHCNLFITGSPKETIYEFNMAYGTAINTLSGYSPAHVHIIHLLDREAISPDIQNVLEMNPNTFMSSGNVSFEYHINAKRFGVDAILKNLCLDDAWLTDRIKSKTPVLIVANSKQDLAVLREEIQTQYASKYPDLRVVDLTTVQNKIPMYGTLLSDYVDTLIAKHPAGTTIWQTLAELYDAITVLAKREDFEPRKQAYLDAANRLMDWYQSNTALFGDPNVIMPMKDIIKRFIDVEDTQNQNYLKSMRGNATVDTANADIILSTIHSAIDLRMDHVLVVIHQFNSRVDMNLLSVALSRAGKSEHLVFIDDIKSDNPYPRYLKMHLS